MSPTDESDQRSAREIILARRAEQEQMRTCRYCDKPGPYFARCADHWDYEPEDED